MTTRFGASRTSSWIIWAAWQGLFSDGVLLLEGTILVVGYML